MSGPRLHIAQPLQPGASIELPAAAAAHARAFRLRPSDTVTLFNGDGGEHPSTVTTVERRRVTLDVGPHDPIERELPVRLWILQAVAKGERMDTAVEKATELGASEIVPILSERTVVRLEDPARAGKRQHHWQAVATRACEQCGRNRIPFVHPPRPLADGLSLATAEHRIVLDPTGSIALGALRLHGDVAVLVGPEGGLSEAEQQLATANGFQRVTAGRRILRTETAAVVALAAVALALNEL